MAGFCDDGNETLSSIKYGEVPDWPATNLLKGLRSME